MNPMMEDLEPRVMCTTVAWAVSFNGITAVSPPGIVMPPQVALDPRIQADLAIIEGLRAQLAADTAALGSIVRQDYQAILRAIRAVDLTPFKDQLKADTLAGKAILKADRQAITAARKAKDPVALAAAKEQLKIDKAIHLATIKADRAAIKSAVDLDPTVIAAREKYQASKLILVRDKAQLDRAIAQLNYDIGAVLRDIGPLPGFSVFGWGDNGSFLLGANQGYATSTNASSF